MSKYFKVCDDYQLQNSTRVQLENNEWHIICNIIIICCCCCFLDGLIKWLHCLETLLWTFGGLLFTGLIQQTVRVWKVPLTGSFLIYKNSVFALISASVASLHSWWGSNLIPRDSHLRVLGRRLVTWASDFLYRRCHFILSWVEPVREFAGWNSTRLFTVPRSFATCIHSFMAKTKSLVYVVPPAMQNNQLQFLELKNITIIY